MEERATFNGFFLLSEVQGRETIILDDEEVRKIFSGKGPEPSLVHMLVEQKRDFTVSVERANLLFSSMNNSQALHA